jgi:uncharacterized RDD family membrane protein YckC
MRSTTAWALPGPSATFAARLGAGAIDWAICAAFYFAGAAIVAAIFGGEGDSTWGTAAFVAFGSVAVVAYCTAFWARSGATPGMRALGLQLEGDGRSPVGPLRLLLRAAAALVSGASVLVILVTVFSDSPDGGYSSGALSLLVAAAVVATLSLAGHLWLLIDGRQTLQDRLFGLVVVPVEARDATSPSAATPARPD